ncbi:MAG TPA: ABC transporter permease [Candidatus Sulfotelmatobacter sp.]|jgi:putative ABC transport system permease protein|nr:ABC transporter permease [Candidatus Sulfotelmatobacter sp.]
MSRSQLFFRLLLRAAWVRKDRALTALISVAVVATIATAALTIYSDLESKLSREFRGFGANVIVTKASGPLNSKELVRMAQTIGSHGEIVPIAYAVGTKTEDGTRVVIGGADLKKLRSLNSAWSFSELNQGRALVGARVSEMLSHGGDWRVSFGNAITSIAPEAIFHSGSDDDSRIYLPLDDFERLTGVQPGTALLRIEGRPREIQATIASLSAALPNAEVKPVRQITQAQTAVVDKTRSVVLAASVVVLVLIMLCMVATFTSSVLERRKDFAVMKALGASNRTVNFLFAAEASLLALLGAAAGYILGSGIAFWIGKVNFDAAIFPQPLLLLPVLLGSMLLALIASTAPLRLLQQIQPAAILRGE